MNMDERWRTSSYSEANGQCIEVAHVGERVLTRDTKLGGAGAVLAVPADAWSAFVAELRR
ncbi:DUF397 domain-containing protein [Streptomyces xiamenensis]